MDKMPRKDREKVPASAPNIVDQDAQAELKARDRILDLLSDSELAKVSSVEGATELDEGEEYIDLEQLGQGVKQADGANSPIGHVLSRRAVRENTWSDILKQLALSSSPSRTQSRG